MAVIREGRVALQLREDSRLWCLPGGAVEPGETLAQAAVREVREETGLEVRLRRVVGVYSRSRWLDGGNHSVLFAATPVGGDLRRFAAAETLDARFFAPTALPSTLLWWHRRMIEDAVAGVGAAVAWALNVVWPFEEDRQRVVERARRDAAFAERLRVAFTTPPASDAERLEVESAAAD
ncbi:MAG TPA: NUDIX domain-containing protein [Candidatus Thermoplasmatota archaeon]|nr:NUDIX domain-containing protein [Candidatus Thermoplasmatota archaeon]